MYAKIKDNKVIIWIDGDDIVDLINNRAGISQINQGYSFTIYSCKNIEIKEAIEKGRI